MDPRIPKAISGDVDAFSSLLLEHYDQLYVLISRKIPPRLQAVVTAEDVLQQVFAEASLAIGSFEARNDRGFVTWLQMIAEHRLLDAINAERADKRGGRRSRVSNEVQNSHGSMVNLLNQIDAQISTASVRMAREERIASMLVHLGQLPPHYREVLSLRYLEGLERAEIARRLNKSETQVRGLLERALERLRDAMQDSSLN